MRRHRHRAGINARATVGWSRGRLIALVIGVAGLSLMLVWGLGLSVISLVSSTGHRHENSTTHGVRARSKPLNSAVTPGSSSRIAAARDQLAARAMPQPKAPTTDLYQPWKPAPLSVRSPGRPIVVPSATGIDSLGVATGFPQTPQGAIGQLASIDQAAMQSGSLPGVRAVITEWAAKGGPSPTSWTAVKVMADLLNTAGLSGAGSSTLGIVLTPAMGIVKGSVGDDFTVVCVDFAADVTLDSSTNSGALADCQRMLWQDGRWVIGPGSEPAPAESVWPDTDASFEVGFRDLELNHG